MSTITKMKIYLLILLSFVALSISTRTKWWGGPWGYYGYRPFYYVYTYPYFFYFRNVNDAPKEAPLMFKLPDDLTDICANDIKAKVCGFDKDKKIIGDFDNMCMAGKDDDVDYIVCGKCPDKDADDKSFDIPITDDMPTCPIDNDDANNVDNTDNNTTTNN